MARTGVARACALPGPQCQRRAKQPCCARHPKLRPHWHLSCLPARFWARVQGTYEECCSNKTFARLMREHNADHSGAKGEGEGEAASAELPPGEPMLLRADTRAVAARAAAEAMGAGGRTVGDAAVQQARLAAAPTFVKPPSTLEAAEGSSSVGTSSSSTDGGSSSDDEDAGAAMQRKPGHEGGKYGKQLARFETMQQQTGTQEGKAGKVWRVGARHCWPMFRGAAPRRLIFC